MSITDRPLSLIATETVGFRRPPFYISTKGKFQEEFMNIFKTRDLQLVAERIRRMLKQGGTGSEVFIRDVTTLVDALENVEEINFKEDSDE